MPLTPGTRLGPYEITAQLGVGGMGEKVYRATDTKLKRQMAIKIFITSPSPSGTVEATLLYFRRLEIRGLRQ